jgi:hypothetical protein
MERDSQYGLVSRRGEPYLANTELSSGVGRAEDYMSDKVASWNNSLIEEGQQFLRMHDEQISSQESSSSYELPTDGPLPYKFDHIECAPMLQQQHYDMYSVTQSPGTFGSINANSSQAWTSPQIIDLPGRHQSGGVDRENNYPQFDGTGRRLYAAWPLLPSPSFQDTRPPSKYDDPVDTTNSLSHNPEQHHCEKVYCSQHGHAKNTRDNAPWSVMNSRHPALQPSWNGETAQYLSRTPASSSTPLDIYGCNNESSVPVDGSTQSSTLSFDQDVDRSLVDSRNLIRQSSHLDVEVLQAIAQPNRSPVHPEYNTIIPQQGLVDGMFQYGIALYASPAQPPDMSQIRQVDQLFM